MATSQSTCPRFVGQGDIYGIGVRIGIYTQWGAMLLVTLFNPKEEETFRTVNLLVQASIFLGVCLKAEHAFEPVIMFFLMCGSLATVNPKRFFDFSHVSSLFRALFYTALSAYGCWFWFSGVDKLSVRDCRQIAFFGETSVDGPFRAACKALSVIGLVFCICLVIRSTTCIYNRFSQGFQEGMKRPRKRPQVELSLVLLSAGLVAFSVTIVEYLIKKNNVQELSDVNAVGQFIPLLIGGMEVVTMSWKVLTKGLVWRKRCWFLFGKHLWHTSK